MKRGPEFDFRGPITYPFWCKRCGETTWYGAADSVGTGVIGCCLDEMLENGRGVAGEW